MVTMSVISLYVENEAYRKDECDAAPTSGSSKRRNQVKKTLSALSNKVKLNIKHEKPLSKCKCSARVPHVSTTCKYHM